MGNQQSSEFPVQTIPDSHVAFSIVMQSKIRVMNAPPDVIQMCQRLDQENLSQGASTRGPIEPNYFGTVKMRVGDAFTFSMIAGKECTTFGKVFTLRLLEEMYKLGYNLTISSDIARMGANVTWFFAKSVVPEDNRAAPRICCIAPGGGYGSWSGCKLILLRHDEDIKQAVMLALGDCWPAGTSGGADMQVNGELLHEISLNGAWGGVHDEGVNTRRTICNMVGRMGGLNWRLLASTNIKNIKRTNDSFYFVYDPTFTADPNDMCMVTLANHDRFRLINANHLVEPMEAAIAAAGFQVQEKLDYYGCVEFKVAGNPWWSSGNEAIQARRSISRIMEALAQQSYTPLYAIALSQIVTDKASILFKRSPFPVNCRFATISGSSLNRIRLLDFPVEVRAEMRNVLYSNCYPFGVTNEANLPDSNLEVNLNAWPWINRQMSKGGAHYHVTACLGKMMRLAEQHGWYVTLSADVSAKITGHGNNEHPVDIDTIYFIKMM